MALAVSALKQEKVSRIIRLVRPSRQVRRSVSCRATFREKILPYLRPLYDALYDMLEVEEIQKYWIVELSRSPLWPICAERTLSQAFVILEAQNTTTEQMFMFLTGSVRIRSALSRGIEPRSTCRGTSAAGLSRPSRP